MRACTLLEQAGGYVIQSSPFDAFESPHAVLGTGRVSRGGESPPPPPPPPSFCFDFLRGATWQNTSTSNTLLSQQQQQQQQR